MTQAHAPRWSTCLTLCVFLRSKLRKQMPVCWMCGLLRVHTLQFSAKVACTASSSTNRPRTPSSEKPASSSARGGAAPSHEAPRLLDREPPTSQTRPCTEPAMQEPAGPRWMEEMGSPRSHWKRNLRLAVSGSMSPAQRERRRRRCRQWGVRGPPPRAPQNRSPVTWRGSSSRGPCAAAAWRRRCIGTSRLRPTTGSGARSSTASGSG
mmetsp:Transcript_81084/g.235201  ORF Transcript_81084/g.235201 Transcript_81084/m.235201 type:complete len:208 (+) Transcript_81084:807-1430(+)